MINSVYLIVTHTYASWKRTLLIQDYLSVRTSNKIYVADFGHQDFYLTSRMKIYITKNFIHYYNSPIIIEIRHISVILQALFQSSW